MKHLHHHGYKWRQIGLSLDFSYDELEDIRHSAPNLTTQLLLTKVLTDWSQWPTKPHPNLPTMEALCDALRDGRVGLGAVASELYSMRDQLPSKISV